MTILSKKKIAEIGIGEVWEKIQNLPQGHQNEHSLPPQNAHLSQKKDIAEEQDGAKDEEGE